jgi:hypothetical protein
MNTFATLMLLFSLPGVQVKPVIKAPAAEVQTQESALRKQEARKGGRWLMAASGHAVYCFGPIVKMPDADGGFQQIATFCQGEKPMVELHD